MKNSQFLSKFLLLRYLINQIFQVNYFLSLSHVMPIFHFYWKKNFHWRGGGINFLGKWKINPSLHPLSTNHSKPWSSKREEEWSAVVRKNRSAAGDSENEGKLDRRFERERGRSNERTSERQWPRGEWLWWQQQWQRRSVTTVMVAVTSDDGGGWRWLLHPLTGCMYIWFIFKICVYLIIL